MTVKNGDFPGGYYRNNFETPGGYGGSDSPSVSEDSNCSKRKFAGLGREISGVPKIVFPLSDLSSSERKDLVHKLRQELEQIRSFQKSVEFPRTNSSADTSTNDFSRAKSFGKSRCSAGPGKKVIPLSAAKPAPVTTAIILLMKQCEALLKRLMSHQYAWVFNTPVDVIKLNIPDYLTVIKHPMDLGTVKSKLTSGTYSSPLEFAADVRLTFTNAMAYNPPGNDVYIMADTLSKFFEVRWKTIEKKLSGTKGHPSSNNSDTPVEKEIKMALPMAKKRKMDAVNQESISEVTKYKQVMTAEYRCKLGRDLEYLGDIPIHIINFLRQNTSNEVKAGDDEIEIDINDLSDDALLHLRKLLDEHLLESRKNESNAEPCEIELLHGSGPVNSSGQPCDGSELDEDVDIGENEPPIPGISPVRIKEDVLSGNSSGSSSSESVSEDPKITSLADTSKGQETMDSASPLDGKTSVPSNRRRSVSGLNQLEDASHGKLCSAEEADCHQDGNSAENERQLPSDKLYRAALLKNRFADLILKAREKTLSQNDRLDPEKLRREREELELQKKRERARLQAEAKAAEEARRRAEAQAAAEAVAEAKRKLELEREAARRALLEMEQSVEINENAEYLKDLEMLKTANGGENLTKAREEDEGCEDGLGNFDFGFGGCNPLEQLGLFMKHEEEEDEGLPDPDPDPCKEIEEGEID
ncbi:PREDICTED: transcription factor GTE9 [Tarenaya hassleriana]|uniref:transcription factor GTE9 n=1 Tax=Tarenaya hassleriana TaxID=28532 RepID=UPI00053C6492|nr:PREDICTED: transcription factor GTE9 [Tarenaya hassleriana]XP_010550190.1 PREDICTED: transcription factor GTE9 [Tarenaya hassleriana]